jgi:hypothetical protein
MASLSGTLYTNVEDHWRLSIEWSGVQSVANNTTTITAKMYWIALDSWGEIRSTATKDGGIYVFGSWSYFSGSGLAGLNANQKKLIHTFQKVVTHNDNGTASVTIDGFFDAEVTLSGTYFGRVNITGKTYTLPTIPRASSLTTSRSFTAGSDRTISISRASTSFHHEVDIYVKRTDGVFDWIKQINFSTSETSKSTSFTTAEKEEIFRHLAGRSEADVQMIITTFSGSSTVGSKTYTDGNVTSPNASTVSSGTDRWRYIDEDFPIGVTRYDSEFTHTITIKFGSFTATKTGVGTSDTFVWDETQRQQLYSQIPNDNKGTGTIEMTTYYGAEKVRSTTSISCEFHVRNSNPTFTADPTYKDVNNATTPITGNDQYIIQNHSSIQVEIPATAKATAINGASMVEYVASLNGVSVVQPYSADTTITFTLGKTQANADSTLVVKAVDSRGNFSEVTKTVLVVPYSPPSINATTTRLNNFERDTTLETNGSISRIDVTGLMKNALTPAIGETEPVQYRYKENTSTAIFGAWVNLEEVATDNTFETTDIILDLDNTKSFVFEFRVTDKLTTTVTTTIVDKGIPIFSIDSERSSVGIGMFPENSNALEVNGDLNITGNLTMDNNKVIYGQLAGGSNTGLFQLTASDHLFIGSDSVDATLRGNALTVRPPTTFENLITANGSIDLNENYLHNVASIYGRYSDTYMLSDHNNGNVTLSAQGGDLYIGYQSTNNVLLRQPTQSYQGKGYIVSMEDAGTDVRIKAFTTTVTLETGKSYDYTTVNWTGFSKIWGIFVQQQENGSVFYIACPYNITTTSCRVYVGSRDSGGVGSDITIACRVFVYGEI